MQKTNREESWVHAYDVPSSLQLSVLLVRPCLLSLFVCILSVLLLRSGYFALNSCDFFGLVYLHDHRLCLGPWSEHGSTTGGNNACNRYESAKEQGLVCFLLDIILLCVEKESHSVVLSKGQLVIACYSIL
jgi:hypothetical protein